MVSKRNEVTIPSRPELLKPGTLKFTDAIGSVATEMADWLKPVGIASRIDDGIVNRPLETGAAHSNPTI